MPSEYYSRRRCDSSAIQVRFKRDSSAIQARLKCDSSATRPRLKWSRCRRDSSGRDTNVTQVVEMQTRLKWSRCRRDSSGRDTTRSQLWCDNVRRDITRIYHDSITIRVIEAVVVIIITSSKVIIWGARLDRDSSDRDADATQVIEMQTWLKWSRCRRDSSDRGVYLNWNRTSRTSYNYYN
jgi:hypothetical protein